MSIILNVHENAASDLESIALTDPEAAAEIFAILSQLENDPNFLDKLTTHGNVGIGDNNLNIKQWLKPGKSQNLWRFRALDTEATDYRVLYGYYYPTKLFFVLAIVHKENYDYDDLNSDINKRILADWTESTS